MDYSIFLKFPTEESYKKYLCDLKWDQPKCPYCSSTKCSVLKTPYKFHCNVCNTNFSVTVNTIMHGTKIDLRKWMIALYFFLYNEKKGYRNLSVVINVNKNTADRVLNRIEWLYAKEKMNILMISGFQKNIIEIISLILLINIKGRF